MTLITILSIISLIVVIGFFFINFSPQFGGKHTKADVARYEQSGNYKNGNFENQIPTSMDMDLKGMMSTMAKFMKGVKDGRPSERLPQESLDSASIADYAGPTRLVWFGHSSFLLQIEGKTILIDPMLGPVPAPHPWLAGKRYNKDLPIEIEKLPQIDAIIISHDHYDHLDYGSVQKLKNKTKKYYVPLGVGAHFEAWGVPETDITEFNWWDTAQLDHIELVFAPSRHFSGRGLRDRFSTLWGSWIIRGGKDNIYFSGDSGYGPHFKAIGEKYGPFDFAMMECGQYNEKWANIHMMPEETAQAAVDVQAAAMMPIHWGAFTLALHTWTDPVERVQKKADELGMPMRVPIIGESFVIGSALPVLNEWWEEV